MGRPQRRLDPQTGPLQHFAAQLRQLREQAGGLSYRQLAKRAHYSATALSEAAGGDKLPSLAVTLAYVEACGGDRDEWQARWQTVAAELASADQTTGETEQNAPYLGLVAFQPEDADRFFGMTTSSTSYSRGLLPHGFWRCSARPGAANPPCFAPGYYPQYGLAGCPQANSGQPYCSLREHILRCV
jgi:hypothetical protein